MVLVPQGTGRVGRRPAEGSVVKIGKVGIAGAIAVLWTASPSPASEILSSANSLWPKRISVTGYWSLWQNEFDFPGRGRFEFESKAAGARTSFRIWHRLHAGARLLFGRASLESPTLKFRTNREIDGMGVGGFARWILWPDTVVTPAFAFELGGLWVRHRLRERDDGATVTGVSQRFTVVELQGAFSASKRFGFLEPYLGVRVFRDWGWWKDTNGGDEALGKSFGASPFFGVRYAIRGPFYGVFEGAVARETTFTASLQFVL